MRREICSLSCVTRAPVAFGDPGAQRRPTGMIDQGSRLAVGCGCDQVPDEAFDVLIPLIMVETVHEDCSADSFHILLSELTFVASMGKDVRPPSPAAKQVFGMHRVPFSLDLGLIFTVRYRCQKILDPACGASDTHACGVPMHMKTLNVVISFAKHQSQNKTTTKKTLAIFYVR